VAAARRIRVLIVDDSAVIRSLLRAVLGTDAGVEVVGTAADGASALQAVLCLNPDLVLLDVEMPVMDGLVTLRELRRRGPALPVIMCSALTQRGARVTLEALAAGASDYVAKPTGGADRDAAMRVLGQELLPKIHALVSTGAGPSINSSAEISLSRNRSPVASAGMGGLVRAEGAMGSLARPALRERNLTQPPAQGLRPMVLAIGVSTGGPAALGAVLSALPADFPLPVLIVQHMPEMFTGLFAEQLNERCKLRARDGAEGMPVTPGTIVIARGNWHMEVLGPGRAGAAPSLHLTQGALENHCRPAVDVLFRSVAAVYGPGALTVVMTGMGSDGLQGAAAIRSQGGTVLVQDQASSIVWGMPGAVARAGLANRVVPLLELAPEVLRMTNRMRGETRGPRGSAVQL
jgi:two-component system chemotaxis response regulator CheB